MLISLSSLISGSKATICSLGDDKTLTKRLLDFGLQVDYHIEVLQGGGNGPVYISIGDTRLAIGHNVAKKILVIKDEIK